MHKVTRRSFVTALGAAGLLPACVRGAPGTQRSTAAPRCLFFSRAEARFIAAACDRLIPADDGGAGATAAGVPGYMDRQLAGPWGAGTQLYRDGSWQAGSPTPLTCTPATLFRITLRAVDRQLERRGLRFDRLSTTAQDAFLRALQDGTSDLGIPTEAFFAALLTMTVEGYFSNPLHSARRERIAWRLGAFPGGHASTATARAAPPQELAYSLP